MKFIDDDTVERLKDERALIQAQVAQKIAEADWPTDIHGLVMLRDGWKAHVEAADRRIAENVNHLRAIGASWAEIGKGLGISKQAAQQRYG